MAASFSSSLHSTPFITSPNPKPFKYAAVIRCGPRGKRGPLVKGRVLSIEAIQAVQALKRLTRSDDTSESSDAFVARTLSRLIKNDLVAAMDELLRQDRCDLALKVFDIIKSEYAVGLDKYAGIVNGLGRLKMWDEIDGLVRDLDGGVIDCVDEKSVVKMLKALTESGRAESLAMMYEIMKRSGWGVAARPDEYTVRVLSRGLRRLGKVKLADQVEAEFGTN
uniref:Pentatricopeptide repeat-containing protein n=1 Tax=Kalanchoe fedtschenkoi TaxID=63787 RepID=A0A7N0TE55_KALFE